MTHALLNVPCFQKLLATAVKPSSKSKKKKNAKANKENSTPAAPKAEEAKAE